MMRLVWRRLAGGYLARGLAGPGVVPVSGVPAPIPSYLPEPPEGIIHAHNRSPGSEPPRPPCRPRVYRWGRFWTWRCPCGDGQPDPVQLVFSQWRHAYRSAVEHVCDRKLRDGVITINQFRQEVGMEPTSLAAAPPDYDA